MFSCQIENESKKNNSALIKELWSVKGKGILFGHQDDLTYGKHWEFVAGESDVKRVTGDYPAVFGFELGGLERGDERNIDSVPFDFMKKMIILGDSLGGVTTISWHPHNVVNGGNAWNLDTTVVKFILPGGEYHAQFKAQLDKVSDFLLQLKNKDGEPIQFIFRPWHEMNGGWFWWGSKLTSPDEMKALFRFTVDYMVNEKGLDNMVICYSPNGGYKNAEEYLERYPGDDIVDMLGSDIYLWPGMEDWANYTREQLDIMIKVANEKNMLAAFTETGSENLPDSLWYTHMLWEAMKADSIADNLVYVHVWRNHHKVHHFFTYPGHPSEEDTKQFLNEPKIWLLEDLKKHVEKEINVE